MATAVVEYVERIAAPGRVYNLRVATHHNYFAAGVLVHNCDDLLKAEDADSDAAIAAHLDWLDGTLSTRGDDPSKVSKILIMQRLSERDATGHLLAKALEGGDQFDHLVLPAEYEPTIQVCLAGLSHDWRTEPNELLWPERWSRPQLEALKVSLGPLRAAGQLQQRPAPATGAIFLREWFEKPGNRYDAEDERLSRTVIARYLSVDTAFKDSDTSDFTALVVVELLPDYRLLVRDIVKERVQFHDLLDLISTTAQRWNYDDKLHAIILEEKGSGISALQQLRLAAHPPWMAGLLKAFMPAGSKTYRARKATQWPAHDMVLLPEPSESVPWLFDFAGPEPGGALYRFPAVAHDDEIDAFTQVLDYLDNILAEGWHAKQGRTA